MVSSQKKGGRRRNENNLIYANPLPITFSRIENRFAVTALGIFGVSPSQVLNPRCEGTFDPTTRSVWITNPRDSMIIWRRGFFGKGNLSRSEPSWLVRQSHIRTTTGSKPSHSVRGYVCSWKLYLEITSEEVTAKRRAERKQFKLDRAQAIAAAAAEAEAAFAEGRIISAEETGVSIPSAATWKPSDSTRNTASPPSERLQMQECQEITDISAEPLEDMEHMQLTLAEAFFLAWALDCLTICHAKTVRQHRVCVCRRT
jgi:tRNA-splicing endonuclease subunit Sen2